MHFAWNYKRFVAFTSFGLALALAACGGGGGSSGGAAEAEGITATSVSKGAVKVLTDAQALAATFPSTSTVEIPSAVDAQVGDVIAVGNTIIKLVATASASSSEVKRRWVVASDPKWATTESQYKAESNPVSNSYREITIDRSTGAYQDKFLMDGSSLVISARCTKAEFKPVM